MAHLPIAHVRESLTQGPRIVEGLIAAAPVEALEWREAPGAWTPVEVLAHLADGEITDWMPRVEKILAGGGRFGPCLLYTSPSPRDGLLSRMPSSA